MIEVETQGQWLTSCKLADYTSWRVGGKSDYLYKPAGREDLIATLKQLPFDIPIEWLGLGSNTLIRDGGLAGVAVITQGALKQIELLDESHVFVEAGVSCATMARFCARNHLASAEFWAGIPGTMGGALRMNAGCFNGETWQHLESVEIIDRAGQVTSRSASEFKVAYRHVDGLKQGEWFLSATFKLPKGNKQHSLEQIKGLLARRSETQPTGEYNCGSVFRNPDNDYAARLIESCRLKGHHIGDAYVSVKHANFITNGGQASAHDIETLINHVAETVKKETGVDLEREVRIIGELGRGS